MLRNGARFELAQIRRVEVRRADVWEEPVSFANPASFAIDDGFAVLFRKSTFLHCRQDVENDLRGAAQAQHQAV